MKTCSTLLLATVASAVTPIRKVVELLTQLKDQVEKDMAADVKMTEAFYEWAEKTEWEKARDIEDGGRQVEALQADIEDATGRIAEAGAEVASQSTAIAGLESDVEKASQIRKKESNTFSKEEANMVDAVDTLERARMVLKSHLSLTAKSSNLRPQLSLLTGSLRRIVQSSWVNSQQVAVLDSLLQGGEGGIDFENPQAKPYESKSGNILETLANLQDQAEQTLNSIRKGEMVDQHNFEMLKQGIEQEMQERKKTLKAAQSRLAASTEEKASAAKTLAIAAKTLEEDKSFLAELKDNMANKDSEHQQSQKSFQDEIAAIEEALSILSQDDVTQAMGRQSHSLVQMRSEKTKAYKLTAQAIRSLAVKFHSSALMQLAALAKADPFGKVKQMITDMIERLERKAVEEAEHKSWCDTETRVSKAKIKDRQMTLTKFGDRVEKLTADAAKLSQDIKRLEGEIADIDASMAKATELRHEEAAEYKTTKADCESAIIALQQAIQVLRNYYEKGSTAAASAPASLVQAGGRKPRDFTANVGSSTGIIGMLEVMEADFSRLLAESTSNEDEGSAAYTRLKQESEVSRASKQAEVKGKKLEVKRANNSRNNAVTDRDSTQQELDAVLEYQSKVRQQCTYKVPTFEERAARREQEIEGLKHALEILRGEQVGVVEPSFLQVHGLQVV